MLNAIMFVKYTWYSLYSTQGTAYSKAVCTGYVLLFTLTCAIRVCIDAHTGVYTGYSALSIALALPDDGQVIACDVTDEMSDLRTKYWEMASIDQ